MLVGKNNENDEINIKFQDSPNLDALARLRVSVPFNLFSSQLIFDKDVDRWGEKTTGSGSITYLPLESAAQLTVGTASGDSAIRQTKEYIRYQPGKSQLVMFTGVFGLPKTNVEKRMGYFDSNNGLFFYQDGNNFGVAIRSFVTGSPVDTLISQQDWNLDKLDGTGPSGVELNVSNLNLFIIDFAWFGINRVRFGIVYSGHIIYCHEFNFNQSTVFMQKAVLPVRYEIKNVGTTTSNTSIKEICVGVFSEGGVQEPSNFNSISTGINPKTVSNNVDIPILSIRSSNTTSQIIPTNVNIINSGTSFVFFKLLRNAVLTNPVWVSASVLSEYDISATGVSGGEIVFSGYIDKSVSHNLPFFHDISKLLTDINGNKDTLTVVCSGFGGVTSVGSSITWQEYR